jgi:hypothetical protein
MMSLPIHWQAFCFMGACKPMKLAVTTKLGSLAVVNYY